MARGKTFTLKGAAAMAFVNAQSGAPAVTDDDRALRVATMVHLNMQNNPRVAIALIQTVAKDGLEAAAAHCTADSEGV